MPSKETKGSADRKVVVENVNVPGYTHTVDAERYEGLKQVLLKILPQDKPGLTQAEMWTKASEVADRKLFPDRGKVGWWMKTAQLDLEAKRIIVRDKDAKPLRWRRVR